MKKRATYATPAQTQRWLKCLQQWAKAHRKTQDDICKMLGFANRSSYWRLADQSVKRVRMKVLRESANTVGLDMDFIMGVYNFKDKFSDARNIFMEFREAYCEYRAKGHVYQASQIVRKAAMFIFETLVPKGLDAKLEVEVRSSGYESARIICLPDGIDLYVISIYGAESCVQFTLTRAMGGTTVQIPVMEGDLDIHAVSAIKRQLSYKKKKATSSKKEIAKFSEHAKKMALR